MVAYTIGISQSSILLGLAYGIFDAIIVVWMRKPLSRIVRRALRIRGRRPSSVDVYTPDLGSTRRASTAVDIDIDLDNQQ